MSEAKRGCGAVQRYDWQDLEKLYLVDCLSSDDIATLKDCSKSAVRYALIREGIPIRTSSEAQRLRFQQVNKQRYGANSAHWKGGRIRVGKTSYYIEVKLYPDSPFYCMANSQGYVLEHRLIMSENIGRLLSKSELVHHINGDRQDNRLENLMLLTSRKHNAYTVICKGCPLRKELTRLKSELNEG